MLAFPCAQLAWHFPRIGAIPNWNGQYVVPCRSVPSLPDINFTFGNQSYPLSSSDYVLKVDESCISAFSPMDSSSGLWIIGDIITFICKKDTDPIRFCAGDVFLRRYFSVFDLGKNAVGFATSV